MIDLGNPALSFERRRRTPVRCVNCGNGSLRITRIDDAEISVPGSEEVYSPYKTVIETWECGCGRQTRIPQSVLRVSAETADGCVMRGPKE